MRTQHGNEFKKIKARAILCLPLGIRIREQFARGDPKAQHSSNKRQARIERQPTQASPKHIPVRPLNFDALKSPHALPASCVTLFLVTSGGLRSCPQLAWGQLGARQTLELRRQARRAAAEQLTSGWS